MQRYEAAVSCASQTFPITRIFTLDITILTKFMQRDPNNIYKIQNQDELFVQRNPMLDLGTALQLHRCLGAVDNNLGWSNGKFSLNHCTC